jgi:hypothetical protein
MWWSEQWRVVRAVRGGKDRRSELFLGPGSRSLCSVVPTGSFLQTSPPATVYVCVCIYIYIYGLSESWLTTSALKIETALSSETLASTNHSTRRFNPKEHIQKRYGHENRKSDVIATFLEPHLLLYEEINLFAFFFSLFACRFNTRTEPN